MAVTVELPGALVAYADGRRRVTLPSAPATVRDALSALWALHPALRDRVLTEEGAVRRHVNVFLGRESIRDLAGLDTPVPEQAEIAIVPAVSGGAGRSACEAERLLCHIEPDSLRLDVFNESSRGA